MSWTPNRRDFLLALVAAGAAFDVPANATDVQVDQIWAEAQSNPWFFEVDEHGTLIEEGVKEHEVWADVFDLSTSGLKTTQDFIDEIQGCYPLTSYIEREIDGEIENLEETLDMDPPASKADRAALRKKIRSLKSIRDEHEEPWLDWIELEGRAGLDKFKDFVSDWLTDPIDWMQSEWIPVRSGPQGAAFGFFEQQPVELLKAIGVVIVDGEHPGSSYVAAELRCEIDEANATAARLGLPFRLKKQAESPSSSKPPVTPRPAPSKLAIAIHGPGDVAELQSTDEQIETLGILQGQNPLPPDLMEVVTRFTAALPKVSSMTESMGRGMKTVKFRGHVKAFAHLRGRHPDAEELRRLWDAT